MNITDIDYTYCIGELETFPVYIVQLMCMEQVYQGNPFDVSVFQGNCHATKSEGGFNWIGSVLGADTWSSVIGDQNFRIVKEPAYLYAPLMKLYADQATKSNKPWEQWEFSTTRGRTWDSCETNPVWHLHFLYRKRHPRIRIGGTTIIVDINRLALYYRTKWTPDLMKQRLVERGMVHLTAEDAVVHAKALINLSTEAQKGTN